MFKVPVITVTVLLYLIGPLFVHKFEDLVESIYVLKHHHSTMANDQPAMNIVQYTREELLDIGIKNGLSPHVGQNRQLAITAFSHKPNKTKRGKKAGVCLRRPIRIIAGHRPQRQTTTNNNRKTGQCLVPLTNKQYDEQMHMQHIDRSCNLSICSLNPWSVCNKTTFLFDFIIDQSMDLFALTETWLSGTEKDNAILSALLPKGYNIKHNPRGSRGGGTALIYKSSLCVKSVPDTSVHPSFELLHCVIRSTVTVNLAVVYRPPPSTKNKTTHQQFLAEFGLFLEHFIMTSGKLLIVGDFNYHVDDEMNSEAADFLDLLKSCDLQQHVMSSTHKSGHTLDLVLSRTNDDLVLSTEAEDHGFPDHYPVCSTLNLSKPPLSVNRVTYRSFRKIPCDVMEAAIKESRLGNVTSDISLQELTEVYDSELRKIADQLAPVKTRFITQRPKADWYNDTIRLAKQKRRQAERLWRKSGLEVHRQLYCCARDEVLVIIDQAKSDYYKNTINENKGDSKKLFAVLNGLLGRSRNQNLPPDHQPVELSTMFSDFFIEKIDKIRQSIPSNNHPDLLAYQPEVSSCFNVFQPVTCAEVSKVIATSPNKSCALDPVPTSIIKMASRTISPVITDIVNKSLASGIFPDAYKSALVTPVLKKSNLDLHVLKNYRPVSNLGFVSKVIEKVVASQLTSYLDNHNLAEPCQSAYRKGHSTETALLCVQNDIIHAIGEQKAVLLVLLDLSAAFDTVNHALLIDTLSQFGVSGSALMWFSSYLDSRKQAVKISGTVSSPRQLTCGVPQGSVLGPLLFTIYTTSLGSLLRSSGCNYHLYADDTQLWATCKADELPQTVTRLQECASLIQSWMIKHQLKLNEDKTEYLIISSKAVTRNLQPSALSIGNHNILPSISARNLGVVMDSDASMEAHITSICKSSYAHIYTLQKVKKHLDRQSMELLVHAFITARLDYCNALLLGLPDKLIAKMQRIQNVAARILTGTGRREHITPVLKSLHWLPVEQRIKFKVLVVIYKAIHKKAPVYLNKLVHRYVPTRQLRSSDSDLLVVPFTRSTVVQNRAFDVAGASLWNELDLHIRRSPSLDIFKSKLKTFLFTQFYK